MAIKSKAQRRKFAELLVEGKITPEVYERWNREAGRKELPERVAKKSKPKTRAKKASVRKTGKVSRRPRSKKPGHAAGHGRPAKTRRSGSF